MSDFNAGEVRVNGKRWMVLAACVAGSVMAAAQSTATKSSATPSAAGDFSIETEMLTYRALQSNSDAMACDVAAYLYGTKATFAPAGDGSACTLAVPTPKPDLGVVVLPFESGIVTDFAMWRSDMNAMEEIERRTECSPKVSGPSAAKDVTGEDINSRGVSALSAATGAMSSLTPIGAGTSAAAGILALLSSEEAVSPVGGTVKDQALMDGVGRGLLSHGISILMPSTYAPLTLTSIRHEKSPFLVALEKLLKTRDCLVATNRTNDASVKDIDAFVGSLSATTSTSKPATAATGSNSASTSGGTASPAPSASVSHLQAVLAADGLAQRLGASPDSGNMPDNSSQHLLMLGALESGGTVVRFTNVLGTRVSYSGGAVDTYALFDLNGQLECSGNVYDYAGAIPSKSFHKKLRGIQPDPASQLIFQRSSCR
jgi:hypothetical protein